MTVNIDLIFKLASLFSIFVSCAAMLVAFFGNRRKYMDERFHEGSKRMDRHDLRLQALEQDVKSMPGREELHRVELSLSEIAGDMRAMSATMSGMAGSIERTERIVGRHEDHLRGDSA